MGVVVYSFVMIFFPIVLSYYGPEIKNKLTATFYSAESVIYNGTINDYGCNSDNVCVRKCCDLNYSLENLTCVFDNSKNFKKPSVYNNSVLLEEGAVIIRIVPGMVKCVLDGKDKFLQLLPDRNPNISGKIRSDGTLWFSKKNILFSHDEYCMDYSEESGLTFIVCINTLSSQYDFTVSDYIYCVGMMISVPFLLATFLVYALLPERNLHAMCLMSHVFAIFVAYLLASSLVFIQTAFPIMVARAISMTILCCYMASIFWVNLMAFDICSTFSGTRSYSLNRKQHEWKRFLIYNIYAWGIPLLFIALILILSNTVTPNEWYDPGVRDSMFIIREGYPTLLYYYGPLAILILSNIVMFTITACKIRAAQKDTAMLSKRGSKKHCALDTDKQLFQLYVRLLFAMGINWSMEIIAWAVNWRVENVPPAVWYISEFFNAAYGVVVFVLFVCKKNVWMALKKRYYKVIGRKQTVLSATASSKLSTRQSKTSRT